MRTSVFALLLCGCAGTDDPTAPKKDTAPTFKTTDFAQTAAWGLAEIKKGEIETTSATARVKSRKDALKVVTDAVVGQKVQWELTLDYVDVNGECVVKPFLQGQHNVSAARLTEGVSYSLRLPLVEKSTATKTGDTVVAVGTVKRVDCDISDLGTVSLIIILDKTATATLKKPKG